MLLRGGSILLAALLTGASATNAAPIIEIPEDVIDGAKEVKDSRGLQSRYGGSSGGYQTYTTPGPTPKPSTYTAPKPTSYTAPSGTGTGTTTSYRGQVHTDEDGRTYVIRKRNGVEKKVYTDTPGWNGGGRQYRQRTGTGGTNVRVPGNRRWGNGNGSRVRNGNRKKRPGGRPRWSRPGRQWSPPTPEKWSPPTPKPTNKWSPPTPKPVNKWSPPTPPPTKWSPPTPPPTPNGWRPGYPNVPSYQGNYNPSYRKTADPTAPEPTEVPTWDSAHGKCVEPFKSACCIQGDHYSFDQKQSLCEKLGCDYLKCNFNKDPWHGDAWKSGNEPTAVPTWDTDGHDPTAMPTWETDGHDPTAMPTWDTDAWEDDTWSDKAEECVGAARTACCSQTKGDELTKSKMCERLNCDYNKCQKEPGWKGDTHEPTDAPTSKPSDSPSVSGVPTWSADGYYDHKDWSADGYDDHKDWRTDGHDDHKDEEKDEEKDDDWTGDGQCSKLEQDRCCSQHESKSLEVQAKNCKNKFGCSIFKCPQYRQGGDGWYGDSFENLEWDDDGHLDDTCTPNEQQKCCEQHDGISITKQQQICKNMWNCSLLKCSKHRQSDYFEKKNDGYYEEEKDDGYYEEKKNEDEEKDDDWTGDGQCSELEQDRCCSQHESKSLEVQAENCKNKFGCSIFKCPQYQGADGWYGDYEEEKDDGRTDGYDDHKDEEKDDDWTGDGQCSELEQDRCCSQHESKSLEVQAKNCKNKFGCSIFKCPQYRQGGDGWYGDSFEDLEWDYDGYLDDTCTPNEQQKCCEQHDGISITEQQQICKNMWNCSLLKCSKHRQSDYFEKKNDGHYEEEKDDGHYEEEKDNGYYEEEKDDSYHEDVCSKDDMISCCSQHPDKPFAKQYTFCTKRGCDLHKCDVSWYEEDKDRCTNEEHYDCCNQSDDIGTGIQHENCVKDGCSLFACTEEDDDYSKPQNKWDHREKPKFQYGYGGDDSTCPDSEKWKCCSPDKSLLGSIKSIVKNCQDLGCEWNMCPQNRDDSLYDNQSYYDSYYEYGGGYDDNDQCTDAGKWNCCNPDESLSGLKAWVRNCQAYSCEWQKCPHHRQGYYDPMKPTVNKYKYDGPPPPEPTYGPTPSPVLKCTTKEQTKCCNYQGTLKEAAKYCQSLECDISDCNKPKTFGGNSNNNGGYSNNNGGYSNNNQNDGGYSNIVVRNDNYGTYGNGDAPQGNKGPNPNNNSGSNSAPPDYGSYGGGGDNNRQGNKGPNPNNNNGGSNNSAPPDYGSYGGDGDDNRRQGNKGPRDDTSDSTPDYINNNEAPRGNTGPRDNTSDTTKDKGNNFLNQGVDENCKREYTAGGACREVCTAKVEYKLMGIVMSTHDETTTRPCS